MLGDTASNYKDELISLLFRQSIAEVEAYCNRKIDAELEMTAQKMTIIKLNRMNSEGLQSQSYSGVSENYVDGYPADIMAVLNRRRKMKVI
jgi:hypothetical protein